MFTGYHQTECGLEEKYDIIVIGSGAGGLASAILLAKAGKKVLVLEQHYVPGGWCHSFQLNGQRFSPGVHYIGLLDEGESTNSLYKGLGVANDLLFFRMSRKAYEHCQIGERKFDLPTGAQNLCDELSKQFPEEKKNLAKYIDVVQKVGIQIQLIPKMKTFWDHVTIPFRTAQMGRYGLFSLKRVINWYLKDPLLKAILNIQCGDHGLPPFKASFPVHCAVMGHYFQGGFYPAGGGAAIVKAMTNALKKHGGEIRVKQNVKKILIQDKAAIGVELSTGERILAGTVISNADPDTTYLRLIGKEHLSDRLIKKLAKTKYSVSSLILFLTLDMDVKSSGVDSGNIWSLQNEDLDQLFDNLQGSDPSEGSEFPAVFISCTTLKDPTTFNGRYHNFEVVTFIDPSRFDEFDKNGDDHSEAYTAKKNKIIRKFLNNIEKVIPGAKQHIVQAELGTPKTNNFYINSTQGNVYGTEKTFTQIGPFAFKNESELKHLYLCGASTLSHGIAGSAYSGVTTASKILNISPDDLLKGNDDQKMIILDAEDDSEWPLSVREKISIRKKRFRKIEFSDPAVPE